MISKKIVAVLGILMVMGMAIVVLTDDPAVRYGTASIYIAAVAVIVVIAFNNQATETRQQHHDEMMDVLHQIRRKVHRRRR